MKKSIFKKFSIDHFITLVGLVGQVPPYIQAFKIFYLQSSYAVSLSANIIVFFSMVGWFVYGLLRNIKPLIITNIFGLIGTILVLIGILYHEFIAVG